MLERLKKKEKTARVIGSITLIVLLVILGILLLINAFNTLTNSPDYTRKRSATVLDVRFYNDHSTWSGLSEKVIYKDAKGERFIEKFPEGTDLVVGDKVTISVGYKNGEETDYIEFIEREEAE